MRENVFGNLWVAKRAQSIVSFNNILIRIFVDVIIGPTMNRHIPERISHIENEFCGSCLEREEIESLK